MLPNLSHLQSRKNKEMPSIGQVFRLTLTQILLLPPIFHATKQNKKPVQTENRQVDNEQSIGNNEIKLANILIFTPINTLVLAYIPYCLF